LGKICHVWAIVSWRFFLTLRKHTRITAMATATKTTIIQLSSFIDLRGSLFLMRCSHCGKCCEKTEMELSSSDIERLEETDYRRREFAIINGGVIRLRNVDGWCYFYSLAEKRCRVYKKRPLGCYLYPVVYLANDCVTVDKLCPMGQTISKQELRTKGKTLIKLLKKMGNERQCNKTL
jgi:Fe-S-cluster containining protein